MSRSSNPSNFEHRFSLGCGKPSAWGNTGASRQTSVLSVGSKPVFFDKGSIFVISDDYDSGAPISGTITWSNTQIADLGMTVYGTYNYKMGSETITFNISGGGGEVPEPTSMAIFGLGALGFAYRNRRKLMK